MKRILLILNLLFGVFYHIDGYSQYLTIKKADVVYGYDDTIYASYYNKIVVTPRDGTCECDNYKITSDGLESVIDNGDCIYYVRSKVQSGYINLKVIYKDVEVVGKSKVYVTDNIPPPYIYIDKTMPLEGRIIDVPDFLFCESYIHDLYNKKIKFKVVFFISEMKFEDSIGYSEINYGNEFSDTFKRVYKNGKKGDKLVIRNIIVADDKNRIFNAKDIIVVFPSSFE